MDTQKSNINIRRAVARDSESIALLLQGLKQASMTPGTGASRHRASPSSSPLPSASTSDQGDVDNDAANVIPYGSQRNSQVDHGRDGETKGATGDEHREFQGSDMGDSSGRWPSASRSRGESDAWKVLQRRFPYLRALEAAIRQHKEDKLTSGSTSFTNEDTAEENKHQDNDLEYTGYDDDPVSVTPSDVFRVLIATSPVALIAVNDAGEVVGLMTCADTPMRCMLAPQSLWEEIEWHQHEAEQEKGEQIDSSKNEALQQMHGDDGKHPSMEETEEIIRYLSDNGTLSELTVSF